jgi:hypothetical protein
MSAGTVYLLHFESEYYTRKHHFAWTPSALLAEALAKHRAGKGDSLIVRQAAEMGCTIDVVRTWEGGPELARDLRDRHMTASFCPRCKPAYNEAAKLRMRRYPRKRKVKA